MIENEELSANGDESPQVIFQKVYMGDASLEVPNAPGIFNKEWQPEVDVQIQTSVEQLSDDMHQVTLIVTVTTRIEGEVAYLAEAHQCGVFSVVGYEEGVRHAILGSYCPSVLFPFARESVADLIQRGGFPQLLLQPVDFDALYRDHMEQANAGSEEAQVDTKH